MLETRYVGFNNLLKKLPHRVVRGIACNVMNLSLNVDTVKWSFEDKDILAYDLDMFCCIKDMKQFYIEPITRIKEDGSFLFSCPIDYVLQPGCSVVIPTGYRYTLKEGYDFRLYSLLKHDDIEATLLKDGSLPDKSCRFEASNTKSFQVTVKNNTSCEFILKTKMPLFKCYVKARG